MAPEESIRRAVDEIVTRRAAIIEEYIRFWVGAQVPDAYMTPEWLADNIMLCQQDDWSMGKQTTRYWVEFKNAR